MARMRIWLANTEPQPEPAHCLPAPAFLAKMSSAKVSRDRLHNLLLQNENEGLWFENEEEFQDG